MPFWKRQRSPVRVVDLPDKRLYVPGKPAQWPTLGSMIGGSINTKIIGQQLVEVLRLAASIQQAPSPLL